MAISNLGSSIRNLPNKSGFADYTTLTERKEALQASQNKNLELSLTTKEGDTVTLSAGSFMEFSALSYDRSGKISNSSQNASERLSSREMTLSSGSQFTFSVKGSLSEQEMDDIENIVKTLDEVINKMSTGNMDDAVTKALEMQDGYETVSGFEANLTTLNSYSFEQAAAKQEYYSDANAQSREDLGNIIGGLLNPGQKDSVEVNGLNQQNSSGEADVLKDSSTRLMEMMLKELDKLREENKEALRKAEEPVDQLFAHYIDEMKKTGLEKNKESLNSLESDNIEMNSNSLEQKQIDDNLIDQLADTRKAMKEEFRKMMPEAQDFRNIASSIF